MLAWWPKGESGVKLVHHSWCFLGRTVASNKNPYELTSVPPKNLLSGPSDDPQDTKPGMQLL